MEPQAVADMLYKQSGLRGISGFSQDMRELLASPRPEATQAIEYFVARIRHETGALAADLKGVDALTFSGGIGEHAWQVRERVLDGMEWLGVSLDRAANRAGAHGDFLGAVAGEGVHRADRRGGDDRAAYAGFAGPDGGVAGLRKARALPWTRKGQWPLNPLLK